jgi:ribosome-binding factor A
MARSPSTRNARLEEEIRSVLSALLLSQVKDPRLEGVTVSGVALSAERTRAKVYFSVIGDEERERQAVDGFNAAGSFLRGQLGRTMRLRTVPELIFSRDTSYEYADKMERLLEDLKRDGLIPPLEADEDSEGES